MTIKTDGAHSPLLAVGQFTAEGPFGTDVEVFVRLLVDGVVVDGMYWMSLPGSSPVAPRAQMALSRLLKLGSGTHTVTMQACYWDGGTDQTVYVWARTLNAVELGG